MTVALPKFDSFLSTLNAAGVRTGSARGFWGGVTADGEIVVTTWIDAERGRDRYKIWRQSGAMAVCATNRMLAG
jgi:hypothetical protein